MPAKKTPLFACQECGRTFNTVRGAEKAVNDGCPRCGGTDIDLYAPKPPAWVAFERGGERMAGGNRPGN